MELFYSSDISASTLRLDREESAHCVRVLRHREGDEINVIDGRGSLMRCIISSAGRDAVEAEIVRRTEGFGAHPYELTMAVCPTKNTDRFEWFAEKAAEFGVDAIVPVIGERSERRALRTDRVRRLVLSAAKQSLKAAVPAVSEPVSVRSFIESVPADFIRLICYCADEECRRIGISECLRERIAPGEKPRIAVLIGPEGDFSPEEVELALGMGWMPVHLGQSRLRTETAALACVAAVYFL